MGHPGGGSGPVDQSYIGLEIKKEKRGLCEAGSHRFCPQMSPLTDPGLEQMVSETPFTCDVLRSPKSMTPESRPQRTVLAARGRGEDGGGRGRAGPGGAPAVPKHPEAAPAARWERWWLDAGWRDAGSRCVAWGFLALQNCSSTHSSSPWAPGWDRCAPGGQGHLRHLRHLRAGGDRTGRSRAVYPAQPSRPPHKGKARAGEERSGAGWGRGAPPTGGPLRVGV